MLLFINFSFVDSFLFTLTHLALMSANSPHLFHGTSHLLKTAASPAGEAVGPADVGGPGQGERQLQLHRPWEEPAVFCISNGLQRPLPGNAIFLLSQSRSDSVPL